MSKYRENPTIDSTIFQIIGILCLLGTAILYLFYGNCVLIFLAIEIVLWALLQGVIHIYRTVKNLLQGG